MRSLSLVMSLIVTIFLAGCSFRSDTILPDPKGAGDLVEGFPTDKSSEIEAFDTEANAYKLFGTLTPEKMGDGRMRYAFSFNEDKTARMLIQARKTSAGNYLLRYAQVTEGHEASVKESALLFLTAEDGVFYILTNISGSNKIEKIFAGTVSPQQMRDSTLVFDTMDQAERMSAYFRDHRADFRADNDQSDYIRIRVRP